MSSEGGLDKHFITIALMGDVNFHRMFIVSSFCYELSVIIANLESAKSWTSEAI
jgi:hypothetical protein